MKKILRIARLELSILFYSPIAWLVLIIFIIQCGVTFIDLIEARETSQQLGNPLKSLTIDVFGGGTGFFSSVQHKLYLYIPLLTMGLMSRELSSGSIKLLFSSPLTNLQIILGKFAAMMAYGLLLVLVLLGIMIAAAFSIEALDVKFVLGGVLGLYLLICAYSAIGLFMSSLTSYQVVAAISTLALFAALSFVGNIGQSTDFVRDITYWISIDGRADNFVNGLISSNDVIYFLLVISLFLTLTIMRLNSGRQTYSAFFSAGRYALLVIAVLAIGYTSSQPKLTGYYDTTRFKDRTLTENSKTLLSQLDKPVKITTYVNVVNGFAHLGSPKFRIFDLKKFDQYTRFLPDLEMNYVTYYDSTFTARDFSEKSLPDRALQTSLAYGFDYERILAPTEIRKQINLVPEENLFVRMVEYDGKSTPLRMFYDMITYPQEAEISAALKRLISDAPVVGILTGQDERSVLRTGDKDYKGVMNALSTRGALINQGFDVMNISFDSTLTIPEHLAVLLVADPLEAYTGEQVKAIADYINKGGNILIAGEPGKQEILNPLMETIGVSFMPGTLLQETKDLELDLVQARLSNKASAFNKSITGKDVIAMPSAVGIRYIQTADFEAAPIMVTDKRAVWNRTESFNLESEDIKFRPDFDKKASVPVALALTRELPYKEQKIIILGDADFMSNGEMRRHNIRTKNFDFAMNMFRWFSGNEFPIDTTRPEPIDNKILVSQAQISWLQLLFLGLMPVSLGAMGTYTLIRRKRN
ncbi:Gldg family protein [uncultured Pontibacter sp.]|uniref:Gldg family protein n=1 Tax=uncultured Pontibacter sp. TaxID=453356 RepID=UPI0026192330|nr:Gldg family protein [uncultured Pontibacter sp.]